MDTYRQPAEALGRFGLSICGEYVNVDSSCKPGQAFLDLLSHFTVKTKYHHFAKAIWAIW
jgi:hypothetical protein